MARENLDVINMAIRKQTALKLAAGNKQTALWLVSSMGYEGISAFFPKYG